MSTPSSKSTGPAPAEGDPGPAAGSGPSRRSYVVVGGGNGSGNRGDEVMWEATVTSLRRVEPGAHVVTDAATHWVSPLPDVEAHPAIHHGVRRLRRVPRHRAEAAAQVLANRGSLGRGLRRCTQLREGAPPRSGLEQRWDQAIACSRAVVVAGSGGLTDQHALHSVVGWGLLTALAARRGVPVAFLGQGVGPLDSEPLRASLASTLDQISLFTVRDELSVEVVRSISSDAEVIATPDWALPAEPDAHHRARAQELVARHLGPDDFVAVSLRSYRQADGAAHRAVTELVGRVVRLAGERGWRVLMVPNVVSATGSDDRTHMAGTLEALGEEAGRSCRVLTEDEPAQVVRAVLGGSRGLFSTRYHPVVFALAEGVPATGISLDPYYTQKLSGALAWYGEQDRVLDAGTPVGDDWLARGFDPDGRSMPGRRARTTELRHRCEAPFHEWLEAVS